jgi:putative aldouronate transport system substrate-binding protein
MSTPKLNRRRFLVSSGAAGIAVAGLGSLAACSSDGASTKGGAEKSAKFKLPTFVAAKIAEPDIAGGEGYDPAYLRYPKELVKSVEGKPGDGKAITFLGATWTTPMPGVKKNTYLQQLNAKLGSDLDMTIVDDNQGDGYLGKFNAIVAGGDLPELVWFPPAGGTIPKLPELLQAKFHDLADYLSGDKVKKYPNLANIPTDTWKTAVINGMLAGVAIPYGRMGQAYVANTDFWKPVGGIEFTSAQDFLDKGKELLDKKAKKYVLEPEYVNALHMFSHWYGAPNSWREKGGKLENRYESDEYREALEFAVKVFKAGLFWPDSPLATTQEKLEAGKLGAYVDSYPGYRGNLGRGERNYPKAAILPFAARKGVEPVFNLGNNSLGWCAINKSVPKERIETMLKVLDYMAAPFGSEERLFIDNGTEGTHFKMSKDGGPVLTDKGTAEAATTSQPVHGLGLNPEVMFATNATPDQIRKGAEAEKKLSGMLQADPTTGHFSDTKVAKGGSLDKTMQDLIKDVVTGRKKISDYDAGVKKWRSGGGDAIRREYEKSIAKG